MEPQVVEILGRNWLINELLKAGIGIASPAIDQGIDLIAYLDREKNPSGFIAKPIQLKASSKEMFSIDAKYEKTNELLLVYVWHLQENKNIVAYAMNYRQALEVADQMGYTQNDSWINFHSYTTTKPGEKIKTLLRKHEMTTDSWRAVIS